VVKVNSDLRDINCELGSVYVYKEPPRVDNNLKKNNTLPSNFTVQIESTMNGKHNQKVQLTVVCCNITDRGL